MLEIFSQKKINLALVTDKEISESYVNQDKELIMHKDYDVLGIVCLNDIFEEIANREIPDDEVHQYQVTVNTRNTGKRQNF